MYLKDLNFDAKQAFYNVARAISSADGVLEESEELLLDEYLEEMKLERNDVYLMVLEDAIVELKKLDYADRRKVYIEFIGLTKCDNNFAIAEQKLLNTIAEELEIPVSTRDDMIKCIDDLMAIYGKMEQFIAK